MDSQQFRAAAHESIEDIITYFDTLPTQRVLPTVPPGYLRPLIPSSPPTDPEPWSAIHSDIESKIKPGLTHWQHPNFMAFFPAGVTYPSILGEMYSAAFTAPAFNWLCSPACTELETIVMDWLAQALSLPGCFLSTSENRGGGVIQVTASDTVATMMIAARERRVTEMVVAEGLAPDTLEYEDRMMELRARLVAVASNQAHSSTAKAALLAGTRFRSVSATLEENLEMTGPRLREVLEQCDRDRLVPYFVTLGMGTTNTCAVDRVREIKAVLAEKEHWRRIWVHVDAAYAGAALVLDEWRELAAEFGEGVDSFNINMHKWLLVNFDASCLFIRNRHDLTSALDITPAYLRNPYSDSGQVTDYRNWSMSLGRRFRALKIWFVMRSYGLTGMQAYIRKTIGLGETFAGLVRERPDLFQIITRPAFGLTVFRVLTPDAKREDVEGEVQVEEGEEGRVRVALPDEACNELTKQVYELVNAKGEIFITSTVVAGVYAIRVVSANPAAEEAYVRRAFEVLVEAVGEVLKD
ncbi:aromatic-L-amino-acid decarboxylase [Aspergillus heteromorphus CBS 117.55]|uniref:Aromatic-L-amino-acid decarboxylase n=1 Tax=Aspergillus heteromorphus CBS 117.55 TaxID=1448321 RepID=A0A317WII8_9EURO|nr:aromatic-L-amino-acid decarboxylase [Aspergillus heteromorphus CBS 117.55]PWY84987.1 aromatic-L-amino-acid decarboxylase [Aspergillus heteromorphus CBS 117.55]